MDDEVITISDGRVFHWSAVEAEVDDIFNRAGRPRGRYIESIGVWCERHAVGEGDAVLIFGY